MAKKQHHMSLIPVAGARYRPPIEQQRATIIAMRDNFRQQGFEAELNLAALAVQDIPPDDEGAPKRKADLENSIRNCDKSARRMDELLAKLPSPKPEKKP